MSRKPIKVFWSPLGNRFYASQHYKVEGNHYTITGEKFDVTDDIARAVITCDIEFTKVTPQEDGGVLVEI